MKSYTLYLGCGYSSGFDSGVEAIVLGKVDAVNILN